MAGVALGVDVMTPGQVGMLNDDAVYATTAEALARGQGYVHPFAWPPEPANRYPIGYPLLLAPIAGAIADLGTRLVAMQALTLACLAGYLLATAWLLRDALGLAPRWALGLTALLATSPWLLRFGSQVMADVPMAAGCVAALAGLGVALRAGPVAAGRLAALGVAIGALGLVHYRALALAPAAMLALAIARRWREAGWLAAGVAGPLGAWAAYLAWVASGAGPAGAEAGRAGALVAGMDAAARLEGVLGSLRFLALKVLPGFHLGALAPPVSADPLVRAPGAPELVAGLALAVLTLAGLAAMIRRRDGGAHAVAGWFAFATLGLAFAWNVAFTFLGYSQGVRLALPIAPILLYAGWSQARAIAGPRLGARAEAAVGAALGAAIAAGVACHLAYRDHPLVDRARAAAYARAYAALREATPPDAHVGSLWPATVYLHTGRRGAAIPLGEPAAFAARAQAAHLDALFLQHGLYTYLAPGQDPIAAFMAAMAEAAPGALAPRWQDPAAGLTIWAVDRGRLPGYTAPEEGRR